MFNPASMRTRLTLWNTAALALPLVAFALVSYFLFSHSVHVRTDAFVTDALDVFARELGSERRAGLASEEAMRRTLSEVHFREVGMVIIGPERRIVGVSGPDDGPARIDDAETREQRVAWDADPDVPRLAQVAAQTPGEPRTLRVAGRAYRVLARPLPGGASDYLLTGIHPLAGSEATLRRIRRLFFIAVPLLIAAAAVGAWLLTRQSLRPVSAMAAQAAAISASTLHERLAVGGNDELGALARVLNDLLDRLERSFEQQRRFMTDASHELRTPTAIVRSEADVTLARDHRDEAEYRASMSVVQDASRRLARIVDDVFLIARADAGHLVTIRDALYLDDLVRETVRGVKPIADERGVTVRAPRIDEAPLLGDADLLDRMILNLLDNAIRHSPEGGTVEVSLGVHDDACDLSVVDVGQGIPEDAHERIFERFFRLDAARAREQRTLTSGAGLGLSICRRIAELHGGMLRLVASRPGYTEFRVTLPLTRAAPAPAESTA